jgi:hypothetical protein
LRRGALHRRSPGSVGRQPPDSCSGAWAISLKTARNHVKPISVSGSIRVSFTVDFSPPGTVILADLKILDVNFTNVPNWLDSTVIKDALNAIFPSTIAI